MATVGVMLFKGPQARHYKCVFVDAMILIDSMACIHACGATLCVGMCRRNTQCAHEHVVNMWHTFGRG